MEKKIISRKRRITNRMNKLKEENQQLGKDIADHNLLTSRLLSTVSDEIPTIEKELKSQSKQPDILAVRIDKRKKAIREMEIEIKDLKKELKKFEKQKRKLEKKKAKGK